MAWESLRNAISQLGGMMRSDDEDEVLLSRRSVLTGLGLAGACAVAAPALLWSGEAAADVLRVQYRGRDHRGRGHHQRHSRSDIRRRCRDRRFRRRNERLCSYAHGRSRRRGTCVSIGPISVCD